jgi:transcriptional regulator with XRE-family HTH domain
MASEAGGDARGIGARLRGAREKRGLTILQAAEKLHVDARMLEALEAGNFAALGALVYVRGHLRRYAELLGEPPPEPGEQYAAAPSPDLTRIPHREPGRDSSLVLPAVIVLGVFAAVGLLWWLVTLPGVKPQPVPPPPPRRSPPPRGPPPRRRALPLRRRRRRPVPSEWPPGRIWRPPPVPPPRRVKPGSP